MPGCLGPSWAEVPESHLGGLGSTWTPSRGVSGSHFGGLGDTQMPGSHLGGLRGGPDAWVPTNRGCLSPMLGAEGASRLLGPSRGVTGSHLGGWGTPRCLGAI